MAMKPYPSNLIIFNIDQRILDESMKLALKRSWTHISDILIRSHTAPDDSDPCNFVHVKVKYGTRHYLQAGDPESDSNWNERMEQHLLSTMRNVSNNAIAFNRHQRNSGAPELSLDYIEFSLESGALTLEFKLDSNGSLPLECAHIATQIRTALGAASLGSPQRVRVPSQRSYANQALAAKIAKAEQAEKEAEEQEERDAQEAALHEQVEKEAEEHFLESPELSAQVDTEANEQMDEDQKVSPLEVTPLTPEEWEKLYGIKDADFAIDYDIWEMEYPDGSSKEYNPTTGQFVA